MTDSAELTIKQQTALLVLMAESREMTNKDLRQAASIEIDKPTRERLEELGLIEVRKEGQAFTYQLTPDGWTWCAEVMTTGRPPARSGPAAGALFNIMRNLSRNLARLGYESPTRILEADPRERVHAAYSRAARRPGARVPLTEIRRRLPDLARDDLDATLRAMARLPDVQLIAEDNLPALTDDERKAAIEIGGHARHIIAIEPAP